MRRALAVVAFAAALASCANAPEMDGAAHEFTYAEPVVATPAPSAPIARYADQNRDGRVTRDEAQNTDPLLAQYFDRYDLDRNNALDRGEFARLEAESRERRGMPATSSPARNEPLSTAPPEPRSGETLNRSAPGRPGEADAP